MTLFGVYWTFYIPSDIALRHGWNFVEFALSPILAMTIFFPLLQRMALITRRENIGSLSDFIVARYGKNRFVGALVIISAGIGVTLFIAQQLKTLALGWTSITGLENSSAEAAVDITFAAVLTVFSILVGARRPTFTNHNPVLRALIAIDGLLKGVVSVAIGLICAIYIFSHFGKFQQGPRILPLLPDGGFFTTIFLLTGMIFCMPHLFQTAFVESDRDTDLRAARRFLPVYFLVVFAGTAFAIWLGSSLPFPNRAPETYTLNVAWFFSGQAGATAVFLFSVFTAATLAAASAYSVATMISDQMSLFPFMRVKSGAKSAINVGREVMQIRRMAIVAFVAVACLLAHVLAQRPGTTIGLLFLSILIQLLPAIVAGITWRRAHAFGAISGILAGVGAWLFLIAMPMILSETLEPVFPLRLAEAPGTNAFDQRLLVSLALNLFALIGVSFFAKPRLLDRIQAAAFIDLDFSPRSQDGVPANTIAKSTVANLKVLLSQFLGDGDAAVALRELEVKRGRALESSDPVDAETARDAERLLAGVVGASLATSIMRWQLSNWEEQSPEIVQFLEQTAQAIRLNREMLQATLNNLSQGVCVVDKEFRLQAWNARYTEIFELDSINVGTSLADIIRLNRARSGYSAEDTERYIRRRLRDVRAGIPHVFERTWSTGKTLQVIGLPMSDGRYVTSFTDVSSVQNVIADLRKANQMLEERVRLRTAELTQVNEALKRTTLQAERARASQARFLAAASHDLLQPLHAARLFLGVLKEQAKGQDAQIDLVRSVDVSIETANRLLNALLNLSRLEVGGLRPEVRPVEINALLQDLRREFTPVARSRGLNLRVLGTRLWALSDEDLLRSILQNLIGNAVRYTEEGSILVLCRRRGAEVVFEVRDSGPGIPAESLASVFEEYVRLPQNKNGSRGLGLGLSIVKRISEILHHRVEVRSVVGEGTTFSVSVAAAAGVQKAAPVVQPLSSLAGLTILCVDDDHDIRKSLESLLRRWSITAEFVDSVEQAVSLSGTWDVILTDYHFETDLTGLDLVERMQGRAKVFALITAEASVPVLERAEHLNVDVIRKPVAPAALRTFLSRVWQLKVIN